MAPMIRFCKVCNKKFKVFPSVIKKGYGLYCGGKCFGASIKGKPLSAKCRDAISKRKKENPIRYWLGKKRYPEAERIKTMKLYDLEQKKGIKIYADLSDGSSYLLFDHIDGMYSYSKTEKGEVVHLSAS